MAEASDTRGRLLNYNVGVLGHVDSGKTSLGKSGVCYEIIGLHFFYFHCCYELE